MSPILLVFMNSHNLGGKEVNPRYNAFHAPLYREPSHPFFRLKKKKFTGSTPASPHLELRGSIAVFPLIVAQVCH